MFVMAANPDSVNHSIPYRTSMGGPEIEPIRMFGMRALPVAGFTTAPQYTAPVLPLPAATIPTTRINLEIELSDFFMEEEFVFDPEAASLVAAGTTERLNIDLSAQASLQGNFTFATDVTLSHPRSLSEQGAAYRFSNITFSAAVAMRINLNDAISTQLIYGFSDDQPLVGDFPFNSKGFQLIEGEIDYAIRPLEFGLAAVNITNLAWNTSQFATVSERSDQQSLTRIMEIIPGASFNLRGALRVYF